MRTDDFTLTSIEVNLGVYKFLVEKDLALFRSQEEMRCK